MRAHAGREGKTLNSLGNGPDLYFWRRKPTLRTLFFSKTFKMVGHAQTWCRLQLLLDPGLVLGLDFHGLRRRSLVSEP
jgi:hypothetical protein